MGRSPEQKRALLETYLLGQITAAEVKITAAKEIVELETAKRRQFLDSLESLPPL